MKLVCPSCSASYEVAPHAVEGVRRVRCARCGSEWVPPRPDPASFERLPDSYVPAYRRASPPRLQAEAPPILPQAALAPPIAAQPTSKPALASPNPTTIPFQATPPSPLPSPIASAGMPVAARESVAATAAGPARADPFAALGLARASSSPMMEPEHFPESLMPALGKKANKPLGLNALRDEQERYQSGNSSPARTIVWLLSSLIVFGIVAVGVMEHTAIANAWPPAARLFSALGF